MYRTGCLWQCVITVVQILPLTKYFIIFIMLMFMYGRMASTLAMSVVQSLLRSNYLYRYYVGFGDVRGSNPSTVRLFLSSIKYVHARQRDEARR